MTASALAIALTAPFTGAIADVLGRKRVITAAMLAVVVPMAGAALRRDVQALIAWRFAAGPAAAADLRRHRRLYRRRMAARRGAGRRRHLHRRVEPRRILRPLRSRRARRSHRLARRISRARGPVAGRRRHRGAAAAAGERVRALRGARRLGAADAAASEESAASRDLRDRLRRPVQLHRRVHLCELPSRRPALSTSPRPCSARSS